MFHLEHGKLEGPVGHTSGEIGSADHYMGLPFREGKRSVKDLNLESSNTKTT